MCDVCAQRQRETEREICFGHEINLPCGTGAERSGSRHNKSNVTRKPSISTSEECWEHGTGVVDLYGNALSTICFYGSGSISCNVITLWPSFISINQLVDTETTVNQPWLPSIYARCSALTETVGATSHPEDKQNHQWDVIQARKDSREWGQGWFLLPRPRVNIIWLILYMNLDINSGSSLKSMSNILHL